MAQLSSQQDLYDKYQAQVQTDAPDLTDFVEGSINDILGGVTSTAGREIELLIADQFKQAMIATADGPEVTGDPTLDYLQTVATSQYGPTFARPQASNAVGTVTFTRANFTAGGGTIPAGTIVKTKPDANGNSQRYATLINETVGPTTLAINASVEAVTAGTDGNADPNLVVVIESPLFDPTFTVTNSAAFVGGAAALNDADYRQFIYNQIETLKGGTIPGIEAYAKTVAGVVSATVIETAIPVIQWDIGTSMPVGAYFYIPQTILYIADANGSASSALVAEVVAGLQTLRAAGVLINVVGATALAVNWTASLTLNPAGPNFTTFENDTTQIVESMQNYIRGLPIGTGFNRSLAAEAIMSIWGPTGTNDLTAFQNIIPTGDISASAVQKLIPGTVSTQ
jgi:hypothetical protein